MSKSVNIWVCSAHERHASLSGSLLATFSVSILFKMLLIIGGLMVLLIPSWYAADRLLFEVGCRQNVLKLPQKVVIGSKSSARRCKLSKTNNIQLNNQWHEHKTCQNTKYKTVGNPQNLHKHSKSQPVETDNECECERVSEFKPDWTATDGNICDGFGF